MRFWRKAAYLLVLLCFTTAIAQDNSAATCSAIVQQAMSSVEQDCAPTGRNQACYGYVSLSAAPREGVQDFSFSQTGDLANVADLNSIRLSRLDPANNVWGIALMKLQANLPDSLPGQNVTFLLFGDVEIENAVEPGGEQPPTVELTSNGNVNVRNAPTTSSSVIGSLSGGEAVTADGRNADSTWLRIQIPDSDALGWVFAQLVTPAADVSALTVVDSTEAETSFTPMQAFYFRTGITQTDCAEAPADGILIQTPDGAGKINLRANDVDIQLGSTAFLQAQPSANMVVSVVEGEGAATAGGETVTIPAGTQVLIPVDENLVPVGAPSDPQPYDETLVQNLPVQVLPEAITIAPPLSQDEIDQSNNAQQPPDGGGLPGGFDTSAFSGMGQAQFCAVMNMMIPQTGMSKEDFIAQLQLARQYGAAYMSAADLADFDQFMQMLSNCT